MKTVYLDNNATTQVAPEVIETMAPFFEEQWGNPSSMHRFGGNVQQHIDEAREKIASFIGANPEEIIFTSCGTESDNMALRGCLEKNFNIRHIITSCVEHPAVRSTCRHLAAVYGYRLTEIAVDSKGCLDMEQYAEALQMGKALVSIMWANNETGNIYPIKELAEMAKEADCIFHTDAVQIVGKQPINLAEVPVDMLSLSGHKLHAPKGVGVLYVRKGTKINPLMIGGHQEHGRRAGTENVPYIVGLGRACELAVDYMQEEQQKVSELRDRLEAGIRASCSGAIINGNTENRLPNTTNISFEFVEGEAILLLMDEVGVCASSGSACTSGSLDPSHVIMAMGVPATAAHGSIRFSFSRYNTNEDVDVVLQYLPGIIKRLRAISPYVKRPD